MDTTNFTSVLQESRVFTPPEDIKRNAHINSMEQYQELYEHSMNAPEEFWAERAEELLTWQKKWDTVLEWKPPFSQWFLGGKLNVSENCLDRHLEKRGDKIAIIWEAEDGEVQKYSYSELHTEVCRFANILKKLGIQKGDVVCTYMPNIPELAIALLACTRIGAVHTVVFGGFSAESLRARIQDSGAKLLLTTDGSFHGGKLVPLKKNVDEALQEDCETIEHVLVATRTQQEINWEEGRDLHWEDEVAAMQNTECEPEAMDAEDPLFILYTSGTTGQPKGILHTTGGYLLYATMTHKWVFDIQEDDVYWCTADLGWITGHSYVVYGPLSNGTTTLMFEGVPSYPKWNRFWDICEKHGVTKFYTAPTAIRAIAKEGDHIPAQHDLSKLKVLGSVGEPINPEAWMWYHRVIGNENCPIVDTWWQTETGGIMIAPLPGITPTKPGSATLPLPGIDAAILKDDGTEVQANEGGYLVVRKPWPGMLRTVWGDEQRYKDTYFGKSFGAPEGEPNKFYVTGDGAKQDEDGYFWVMGRLDDVLNVSGHRIGTAEVESSLVSHMHVAEAAVVGVNHEIKGQALYAFVTMNTGIDGSEEMHEELRLHVGKVIGPIAKPDYIQFVDALPKTRSGKIMRRILKAIANNLEIGDVTTLADANVVEVLAAGRAR